MIKDVDKLIVTGKTLSIKDNRTISGYIMQDSIMEYKVTKNDGITLTKLGLVSGKYNSRNKLILTKYIVPVIDKDSLNNISLSSASEVVNKKLDYGDFIVTPKNVKINSIAFDETRKDGKIVLNTAIVDKGTKSLVGYRFLDGQVISIDGHSSNENKRKYQTTITKGNSATDIGISEGKVDTDSLIDDVDNFIARYSKEFKVRGVEFGGGTSYYRVELFKTSYTEESAKLLLKEGNINSIEYIDKYTKITEYSKDFNSFAEVVAKLNYGTTVGNIDNNKYVVTNDNGDKLIAVKTNDIQNLIDNVINKDAKYGLTVINKKIILYERETNSANMYNFLDFSMVADKIIGDKIVDKMK